MARNRNHAIGRESRKAQEWRRFFRALTRNVHGRRVMCGRRQRDDKAVAGVGTKPPPCELSARVVFAVKKLRASTLSLVSKWAD
jgi:hypothetical protein